MTMDAQVATRHWHHALCTPQVWAGIFDSRRTRENRETFAEGIRSLPLENLDDLFTYAILDAESVETQPGHFEMPIEKFFDPDFRSLASSGLGQITLRYAS